MPDLEDAAIVLEHIKGREDYIAVPMETGGFRPVMREHPLTPQEFLRHMHGELCFGCYVMRPDHTCWMTILDIDNKESAPNPEWKDIAAETQILMRQFKGIDPVGEISQSGEAAHIWIFYEEPVPAYIARRTMQAILQNGRLEINEIFPKQDQLTGKGLGNLIRYPLAGKSTFYDFELDRPLTVKEAFKC